MPPRSLRYLNGIDVGRLNGVGQRRQKALANVGVSTILDLLTYYPRRYLDRTAQAQIAEMADGEEASVLATVKRVSSRRARTGRVLVEVDVFDGSSYLRLVFFNQPWRSRQLKEGQSVLLFGKIERYRGRRQMTNPVVDLVGDRTGRIVPLYPQSDKEGLTSWDIGAWIAEALRRSEIADPLPEETIEQLELASRDWAMHAIHLPESLGDTHRARRRLAFDELLRLQLTLVMRKRIVESDAVGIAHRVRGPLVERFLGQLPFPLTGAQRAAIADIDADLGLPRPMHRLLQGDVGAGKTLVAVAALLTAVDGGHQGALMAPTEVLAEQHHAGVAQLLDGLQVPAEDGSLFSERPLKVGLLTSRTPAAERRKIHAALESGGIDIVIGTHALLTESVAFESLGVVVIDEQHRFGVEQRSALRDKGSTTPDVLVMTATPIPRTAAMTVYGDLDTTVLGELPPGRMPVATSWAQGPLEEEAAWAKVRDEVAAGRQVYVVCPLVDGSERVEAGSATEEFHRLGSEVLPDLRLGLLHGQLPSKDKDAVMSDFRSRKLDVLVATTVIEVGVDVPNATVMVIEDADRFGIAQLHQLRGRVGRGADRSWCFLFGDATTAEGEARLKALEESTDGFALAEVDLDLRGEGTILGTRQKGVNDLKLASLRSDRALVNTAREVAFDLVGDDGRLDAHPDLADELAVFVGDEESEFLFKS